MSFGVAVHNWRAVSPGDFPFLRSFLTDLLLPMKPDIFVLLDDEIGSETVQDLGSAQYTNSVDTSGSSEVVFEKTGLYPDDGTAVEFLNEGAITFENVAYDDHVFVFITNIDSDVAQDLLVTDDVVVSVDSSSNIRINNINTTLNATVPAFVMRVTGGVVQLWDVSNAAPVYEASLTTSGSNGSLSLTGEATVLDNFALIDDENADIPQILIELSARLLGQYDPSTGIIPEDITPEAASIGTSDDQVRRASESWNCTQDGRMIMFAGGRVDSMYQSDDFGETWTGPIDKTSELTARFTSGALIAGSVTLNDAETIWAVIVGSASSTTNDYAVSFDDGDSWSLFSGIFYGFGIGFLPGSNRLYVNGRSASSGGVALTYVSDTLTGLNSLVHNSGGTGNGGGIIPVATSRIASVYQSRDDVMINVPGSVSTVAGTNLVTASNEGVGSAHINGTQYAMLFNSKLNANNTLVAGSWSQTDENGDAQSNPSEIFIGAKSGYGFMRGWVFVDGSPIANFSKLHFETNRTDDPTQWGGKTLLSLPEPISSNTSNPKRGKCVGIPQNEWIISYTDENRFHRLLKFRWPLGFILEDDPEPGQDPFVPDPEPVEEDQPDYTSLAPSETICLINAEVQLGLTEVLNEADDALGTIYAPAVTTSEPKFGTRTLAIPRRSIGLKTLDDGPQCPEWRAGLTRLQERYGFNEIGLRNFTIEGWVKPSSSLGNSFLGSCRQYLRYQGKLYRYGGFDVLMNGTDGNGTVYVGVGMSIDDAIEANANADRFENSAYTLTGRNFAEWDPAEYNHIRVCRWQRRFYIFVNGRAPGRLLETGDRNAPILQGKDFEIGSYLLNGNNRIIRSSLACRIDGFRFIMNEAISTNEFVVPSAPYTG